MSLILSICRSIAILELKHRHTGQLSQTVNGTLIGGVLSIVSQKLVVLILIYLARALQESDQISHKRLVLAHVRFCEENGE